MARGRSEGRSEPTERHLEEHTVPKWKRGSRPGDRSPKLAEALGRLLLALGAVAATLLLADVTAWFVLDVKAPGHEPGRFFEFSPFLGHFHRPNAEGWWYRYLDGTKYRVRINPWGFADRDRELEKTRPRIALLGDSTTEFWEAPEEDRGQEVLERELGGAFEVLNFGVRAFGTDQSYLLFEEIGSHFAPDIVVHTFCINDVFDNVRREVKPAFVLDAGEPRGLRLVGRPIRLEQDGGWELRDYSWSLRLLHHHRRRLRTQLGLRPRWRHELEHYPDLRLYKREWDQEEEQAMALTLRLHGALADAARDRGMRFLLVEGVHQPAVSPDAQDQLRGRFGDVFDFEHPSRALAEGAASDGYPFVSLAARVRERGLDASDLMHREDDMHLDRRGIRLFVDVVADALRAQGWVEAPRG